mmetsp:Transcript_4040/g.5554  ORF Transcript_4040/g.5554 Transcript_4040/m.5554 type:complete len:84 (+) Transcript_4040:588-839(+)
MSHIERMRSNFSLYVVWGELFSLSTTPSLLSFLETRPDSSHSTRFPEDHTSSHQIVSFSSTIKVHVVEDDDDDDDDDMRDFFV